MGSGLLLLAMLMMMVAGMTSAAAPAQAANYADVVQTTVDAYIRFSPRAYGELMYRGITSAPVPNDSARAPLGQFGYRNELVTPDVMVVVRSNNDTIYGNGCYGLHSREALAGHKPPSWLRPRAAAFDAARGFCYPRHGSRGSP